MHILINSLVSIGKQNRIVEHNFKDSKEIHPFNNFFRLQSSFKTAFHRFEHLVYL